jgi:hypothetical protein
VDSLTSESIERNGNDAEAQRVARDAIMEIPAFPELLTRLTRVFGPGPERDMVHQLVYWFSKPKMQDRWTAYLTRENWRDQRGLNRKQVDKGRRRLKAHPSGVVEEKMGPYKRIHYRIDWVKLAALLGLETPLKGVPIDDGFDDFDDFDDEDLRTPLKGVPKPSDPPLGVAGSSDPPQMDDTPDTYAENSSNGGVPSNTGALAGEYLQDNSTLQVGAEPAKAEPAPLLINKDKEPKEGLAPPSEDKRHSQNGHTPSESGLERERVEEVVAPPKPDDDTLLAEVKEILDSNSGRWSYACYIKNDYPPEKVAGYIITNAEDIKRPEVVTSVPRDELEQAVGYVLWEAVA